MAFGGAKKGAEYSTEDYYSGPLRTGSRMLQSPARMNPLMARKILGDRRGRHVLDTPSRGDALRQLKTATISRKIKHTLAAQSRHSEFEQALMIRLHIKIPRTFRIGEGRRVQHDEVVMVCIRGEPGSHV